MTTIRVYLKQTPEVFVDVVTRPDQVRAKLKGIRRDINHQKFARWAPFAGHTQGDEHSEGGYMCKIIAGE